MHSQGVLKILKQLPPPLFIEKKRRCLPPKDLMKKISKRTRITKFTPLFVFYGKVTEALRKCYRFDLHLFSLPFHQSKVKYAYPSFSEILRKHYESPRNHFSTMWRSLPPSCFLLKQPNFQNVLEGPRLELLFTPLS